MISKFSPRQSVVAKKPHGWQILASSICYPLGALLSGLVNEIVCRHLQLFTKWLTQSNLEANNRRLFARWHGYFFLFLADIAQKTG